MIIRWSNAGAKDQTRMRYVARLLNLPSFAMAAAAARAAIIGKYTGDLVLPDLAGTLELHPLTASLALHDLTGVLRLDDLTADLELRDLVGELELED